MLERNYIGESGADSESHGALQKLRDEVAKAKPSSDSKKCEPSPIYNTIINQVINTVYDTKVLGDRNNLRNKYNCDIKTNDDAIKFADKAVKELGDPYTDVYSKTDVALMKTSRSAEYYGIGMSMKGTENNPQAVAKNVIDAITKGGAAEEAGLQVGDSIMKVDGNDVTKLDVNEISALIRSENQLPISLIVNRNGAEVDLGQFMRQKIENKAVEQPVMKDGISIIKVNTFIQSNTSEELKAAIEQTPTAKAYIIDLRDNRGGLTIEAFRSLSLIMSTGTLAIERERVDGKELKENQIDYYKTKINLTKYGIEFNKSQEKNPAATSSFQFGRHQRLIDKPLVVLVDGHTASASEIFAGAVQDNKLGTLIGNRTFGKGIGQVVDMDMPEGTGLSVTSFRLFTPKGRWVGDAHNNRIGLKPDIEVKQNEDAVEVSVQYLKKMLTTAKPRKAG